MKTYFQAFKRTETNYGIGDVIMCYVHTACKNKASVSPTFIMPRNFRRISATHEVNLVISDPAHKQVVVPGATIVHHARAIAMSTTGSLRCRYSGVAGGILAACATTFRLLNPGVCQAVQTTDHRPINSFELDKTRTLLKDTVCKYACIPTHITPNINVIINWDRKQVHTMYRYR